MVEVSAVVVVLQISERFTWVDQRRIFTAPLTYFCKIVVQGRNGHGWVCKWEGKVQLAVVDIGSKNTTLRNRKKFININSKQIDPCGTPNLRGSVLENIETASLIRTLFPAVLIYGQNIVFR